MIQIMSKVLVYTLSHLNLIINSSARKVAFDPFGDESSGPEMLSSWPKFI